MVWMVAAVGIVPAAPAAAQVAFSGSALVSQAEHRVNAGRGVEQASGSLFGASFSVGLGPRIILTAQGQSGTLNADSASADDLDEAEGGLRVDVLAAPWLAIEGGVSARSFATTFARQRWTAMRFGAEARLPFVSGAIEGRVRAELLPAVSVTGIEAPNRAVAAAAGLAWKGGPLTAGLEYVLERYDFPLVGTIKRHEQLSVLTVRLGVRFGPRDTPAAGFRRTDR